MNLFLINLIPVFTFLLSLIIYHQNNKKNILSMSIICNSLSFIHYLLLGGISGAMVKIVAILRDSFIVTKKNPKTVSLVFFLFIYVILNFVTYNGFFSIFSIIPAFIYTFFLWQDNIQKIRMVSILTYQFWIIYNLSVLSYSGAALNLISSISVYISLKNHTRNIMKIE